MLRSNAGTIFRTWPTQPDIDVLTDPAFDVLRDDPRYEELAARFGF